MDIGHVSSFAISIDCNISDTFDSWL